VNGTLNETSIVILILTVEPAVEIVILIETLTALHVVEESATWV
jgi:hypothetical protein